MLLHKAPLQWLRDTAIFLSIQLSSCICSGRIYNSEQSHWISGTFLGGGVSRQVGHWPADSLGGMLIKYYPMDYCGLHYAAKLSTAKFFILISTDCVFCNPIVMKVFRQIQLYNYQGRNQLNQVLPW